jgi:hypothetical protein
MPANLLLFQAMPAKACAGRPSCSPPQPNISSCVRCRRDHHNYRGAKAIANFLSLSILE